MTGKELIETFTEATELPKELIEEEVMTLIKDSNFDADTLTIDELRVLMVQLLQKEILLNKKRWA